MPRYFTLDEAQRLIPEVSGLLDKITENKMRYDEAEEALKKLNNRIMMMGGSLIHPGDILEWRSQKEGAALAMKKAAEDLQSVGCLLKDLDMGLLDFPTLYRGEEVYLCWKRGEHAIEFWHGVTEVFRGRKPIDSEFIANHRGGVQ